MYIHTYVCTQDVWKNAYTYITHVCIHTGGMYDDWFGIYVYDDVTYVYDDVTYVYDDVTYG